MFKKHSKHCRGYFSLNKGDAIGVFSSSYPLTCTGKIEHYRSGNIQQRAEEFNKLLYDPDVKCPYGSLK